MGVGKSTTSKALQSLLPNCVLLDGDWCWNAQPFIVTNETKSMVLDNITYLLNNFLSISAYDNIIFCWVMQDDKISNEIISKLNLKNHKLTRFTLFCSAEKLSDRLLEDVKSGIREQDIIQKSLSYLERFKNSSCEKIDVSEISANKAAQIIYDNL